MSRMAVVPKKKALCCRSGGSVSVGADHMLT
jgi:hypothetical protein